MELDLDDRIRAAAFAFLDEAAARNGGFVTRLNLGGFRFEGSSLPLISPQQGIWKPRSLEAALSILTTYAPTPDLRPYEDEIGPDGYPRYKWRGSDPRSWDNVALRRAMEWRKPLAWFVGIRPGVYDPIFPVWLVDEEPDQQQFVVAIDQTARDGWAPDLLGRSPYEPIRRYAQVLVKTRLHQRVFRHRVVLAYNTQCALCRLRHPELLDAAHIKEDAQGGEPVLPNGVSMCAIHHRAFDSDIVGVRPDYVVEIRPDVLAEIDGPTLQHALQGLHREKLILPLRRADRPSPDLLEERYARFRATG